jgi:branched-subunit amino acid ABC-type transport system permease component
MLDLLLNLAAVGLTVGSLYALIAVSFGLIFNMTHVFHLAHGAVFTIGGYLVYWLTAIANVPLPVSVLVSVAVAAALGIAVELGLYRPLREAAAPPMILFLGSVGVLVVVEGLVGLTFGSGSLTIAALPLQPMTVGPVTITTANLAMLSGWLLIALVVAYLVNSRNGRFLRAVADQPRVAASLGVPVRRTFLLSFALGSGLAVPAALLYGWSQGFTPTMGLNAILIASAAVIIGGRTGLLPGAVVALVLGTIQAILVAFVPTGWQEGATFAILLAVLLMRPQGLAEYAFRW